MPRKRPAALRFDARAALFAADKSRPLPGISAVGMTSIHQLERRRAQPGATLAAIREYRSVIFNIAYREWDDRYGCDLFECCHDPLLSAVWLHIVLHNLRRADRHALMQQIEAPSS